MGIPIFLIAYCFNLVFAALFIIMVESPSKTVSIIKYLKDPNAFIISSQESAAPGLQRLLLLAAKPYFGSDPQGPKTQYYILFWVMQ